MDRLICFLRSVIPEDPWQLLFLAGSILLFICMQLPCYPPPNASDYYRLFPAGFNPPRFVSSLWGRLPIEFAGGAGVFICFWPGPRPLRRSLMFVVLPGVAGFAFLCEQFLSLDAQLNLPGVTILEHHLFGQSWRFNLLWSMGPAFHTIVLGFIFVAIFLSRQGFGLATLPLKLPQPVSSSLDMDRTWKRIEIFVWASIPGMTLLNIPTIGLFGAAYRLGPRIVNSRPLIPVAAALGVAMLACVAAWAVGEIRWKNFKEFILLPGPLFAFWGAVIPVAITLIPNIASYVTDRIHWGIRDFGRLSPPTFMSYFRIPDPFYFWYFLGVLPEEIIWRGYLQPRFIDRYGQLRGVFLIGLSWGAVHFLGDFQGLHDDIQIPLKLIWRLSSCVPMSYVLGWLTLRSGSIWPAILVHGLHNVGALSGINLASPQINFYPGAIVTACYAVLGYLLFRYWPATPVEKDFDAGVLVGPGVNPQV